MTFKADNEDWISVKNNSKRQHRRSRSNSNGIYRSRSRSSSSGSNRSMSRSPPDLSRTGIPYGHFKKNQPSFKMNIIVSKEINSVFSSIQRAKQIEHIYYSLPKHIINVFYKKLDENTKKKALSYFLDSLSKNVYGLLSKQVNIFGAGTNNTKKSDLIRQYDLDWFDHYHLKTKDRHQVGELNIEHYAFNKDKQLSVRIVKYIHNGTYVFTNVSGHHCVSFTIKQYKSLKKRYNHSWSLFSYYVFLLGLRYKVLGNQNSHCSIPPNIISKFNLGELFGSPLNTISNNYYSPFEDIGKYFGSNGNFFTSNIPSGSYIANPPFDVFLVQSMFEKLISCLNLTPNLMFLVNIPIYYELKVDKLDKYKNKIDNIKECKYYIGEKNLGRKEYCHYNYYNDQYIPVCNTKLILLSNKSEQNTNIYLENFCNEWKNEVALQINISKT